MASKIVINLDTSKETFISAKCKQNDDLTLEASIFENGLEKDLTNAAITIQALKADNTYIIQNTNITKENNKIIANLIRDFSRVPGTTKIEILLVESGKQNTTFSFVLEVVGSVIRGPVESFNTVTILEELGNKIVEAGQVRDETEQLIQSGGAATTGDIQEINSQLEQIKNNAFCVTDYGGVGNGITDNTEVLKNILSKINVLSKNGGAIFFPQGEFLISNDLLIDKKVTIFGLGNSTRIKLGGKITVDDNPYNLLRVQDIEIETISSNACFDIFKNVTNYNTTKQSLNTDLIFSNVHFYTELESGKFIDIKQTCDSIFSNCIFQSKTNNSGYDGVYFSSYDKKGVRNPIFNCCKFVGLNYCVKAIGVAEYYQYTCGIRFLGCFIMDSNYGIYAKDIDWLTFENGMIDYTDFPIKTHNVSNLKVKNNYLFSRRKEVSSSCVEVVFEDVTERFFPEIVGNHMWNSSYGNLNEGVITRGVTIKAIANTKNCTVKGAIIGQNTIHRVTRCIELITENLNGNTATITYANINNNNLYMANRGIYATSGITKTIAPNNLFNTIVTDVESVSDIPLSNIVTKKFIGTLGSSTSTTEIITGIDYNRIIGIELVYDDNVYTYDVSAYLKENGKIMVRKRQTAYNDFIVNVIVKYIITY